MRNRHLIEAEMAALKQKIDRQQTTIGRVKADKRYLQAAEAYLTQLTRKLASLERISAARKNPSPWR